MGDFELILAAILSPDNTTRTQAEVKCTYEDLSHPLFVHVLYLCAVRAPIIVVYCK